MKKIVLFPLVILMLAIQLPATHAQCNNKSNNYGKSYNAGHKDIVDIAVGSDVHTTLVTAVKAAGLVETLKSEGPFTVFAPTNAAFGKLPSGTVETLLQPKNKTALTGILSYHVISANLSASNVVNSIQAGGGKFEMKTVNGAILTAMLDGNKVVLRDQTGNISTITATDLEGSNGIIHIIDTVVLPK